MEEEAHQVDGVTINCLESEPDLLITGQQSTNYCVKKEEEIQNDCVASSSNFKRDCSPYNVDKCVICDSADGLFDSMICVSGSKLLPYGFDKEQYTDDIVMLVNCGGEAFTALNSPFSFKKDFCFHGGEVLKTDEDIVNGGQCPCLYHSARFGNFSYAFKELQPGDYIVDLHFAEIINKNGPRGMRVFNVYIQEEKVLSELDIYSVVGANRPLQLVDTLVRVSNNQEMIIRFEGIHGSPLVCGLGIRTSSKLLDQSTKIDFVLCTNCEAKIELHSVQVMQGRVRNNKDLAKCEKKIEELTSKIIHKTDECYEAWMSLTAANKQLEKLRMELDNKSFKIDSLDRIVEKQAEELECVSTNYARSNKLWSAALKDLAGKIEVMKFEQSQLSQKAHECGNSIPELSKMIVGVQALVIECENLKHKYSEEMVKRKKLYNQILETKGNIRVFCRCRPLNKEELANGCATVIDFDGAKDGDLVLLANGGSTKKNFKFDRVFTPKDDQVDVYADASPLVVSVLDGYNVCIFAYGQTGTGKTFTMEGTGKNRGVNYRTVEELFKVAREREDTFSYQISVSVLEVYNEQIRDLLATTPSSKKLEIRQASEGSHHVPGIVEAKVGSTKEVWEVLQVGSNARAIGSNNMNEHSSRSHCMLCIMVHGKNLVSCECAKSKLWLIDLAGSERLARTEVQGERLKEAQNINRSLSALGDVISALAAKNSHIPYRNSKLTHILQDSLGGESKTLMFVQISPSENDLGETLSSLNFATRVRGIEFGPAKKQIDLSNDVQKLKQVLEKARQESRNKEESIKKLEENCQNLEGKLRSRDQQGRHQVERVKELENLLELRTELQGQSERQLHELSDKMRASEEKIKELENRLREQQQLESFNILTKVKETEQQIREQQDMESLSLRQTIRALEVKLKEKLEIPSESKMLRQKVNKLEAEIQERGKLLEALTLPVDQIMPIHTESEPRECFLTASDAISNILQDSNSINQFVMMNQASVLKGTGPLSETQRKGDRRSVPGESENKPSILLPLSQLDKKQAGALTDMKRPRHNDSRKAVGKCTRTVKSTPTHVKIYPQCRVGREQLGGVLKDKDKIRVWSR